jgi:putative ABC transport system substrate-binding protein
MRCSKRAGFLKAAILGLAIVLQAGCNAPGKVYTIGILSRSPYTEDTRDLFEGFKEGMAARGYVENENVRYFIHQYYTQDDEEVDTAIKNILARGIDLLVTTGDKTALRAKEIVAGSDMPVLFSSSPWPVALGIVESLKHPGGNMTGVRFADTTPKALELLKSIKPGLKKIFVPYCPDDVVSVSQLSMLNQTAVQMGLELVVREVKSVEEAVAEIEVLPEDVGGIFMIISPTLNAGHYELGLAALKRGVLSGSIIHDDVVLLSLVPDLRGAGKKMAHIANQILMGQRPGDLPVETPEVMLRINLRTAEQIGVSIPEVVLAQAADVIR